MFRFSRRRQIDSAGNVWWSGHYVLTGDIETDRPVALSFKGRKVDVDLNGRTIASRATGVGRNGKSIGVEIRSRGEATVRNGAIRGCDVGIQAHRAARLTVRDVDFSHVNYMGLDAIVDHAVVTGSTFARIGGFAQEAYSVGINVRCREQCLIDGNAFSELYRQRTAGDHLAGEGAAVILVRASRGCVVSNNTFENRRVDADSVGVWVAVDADATITGNVLDGFALGVVGEGTIRARRNALRLTAGNLGTRSYGVCGGPGSEFADNRVVGYAIGESIKQEDGTLRVLDE